MSAAHWVSFAGSAGVLELDNLAAFHDKISGLTTSAEKIDLGGFAYSAGETVSWTQSGTSGTLTVHDGAKTASLTLLGTYTTSSFHFAGDGHGGTFVSDPSIAPATRPAAGRFVEVAARLRSGRDHGLAAAHAAGTVVVSAPRSLQRRCRAGSRSRARERSRPGGGERSRGHPSP
jgi:hypothetical protein